MGSKSSTASTNTTQDFTTNNVDNRASGGGDIGGNINVNLAGIDTDGGGGLGIGGAGAGINTNITTSDFGALDAAKDISEDAFNFSSSAVAQLGATASNAIDKATEIAQSATQDEGARTQQFLILGGIAVAVILGATVIFRSKK